MPPKPKRIKKVSDKELQANTLTALKKRASRVNADFRTQIKNKKKECVDNAKRARQALIIKMPKTSSGSVDQRKNMLINAIKSRTKKIDVEKKAMEFRLARARQKEQNNAKIQKALNERLLRLRARKKARSGAGAGARAPLVDTNQFFKTPVRKN
jgi:hypothetical protein